MSEASAEKPEASPYVKPKVEAVDADYRPVTMVRRGPSGWPAAAGLTALGVVLGGGLGLTGARMFDAPVEQRLIATEERLEDLDKITADEAKRVKALVAVETAALRADVESLKEQAARGEGGFTAAMTPAAIFAVESVMDAARAGKPFGEAYKALSATLPNDPNVKSLAAYADIGAPTLGELKTRFVDAELAVTRASGGKPANGAAAAAQGLLARFVTVRKSDVSAMTRTEAAMARASDRLKADDLAGAADEIATLTGAEARAAKPWLDQAQARLAVDGAVGALKVRLDRARGL